MCIDSAAPSEGVHVARPRQLSLGPGETWALASSVSYALYNFVSRIAVLSADPLVAPVIRMIPTLAFAWRQSRSRLSQLRPSAADFMGWRAFWALFLGGVVTTGGNIAYFYALQMGGIVFTAPVLATNMIWSAVFAAIFLREALAPRMALGILIAALGIGTLGYARASGAEAGAAALPTLLLSLAAAAGWAGASNTSRYALQQGVDRYITIAAGQTMGMLVAIAVLFAAGRGALLWSTDVRSTGLLLVVGVLGTIAFVCLTFALSLTTVATASLFGGTSPIISTTLAVLLLSERLGWLTLFGTALTLAGVLVFQSSPLRQGIKQMQV